MIMNIQNENRLDYNSEVQEIEQLEDDVRRKLNINRLLQIKTDDYDMDKYSSHGTFATATMNDSERMRLGISVSKMRRPFIQEKIKPEKQTYTQMLNMGRLRAEQKARQSQQKSDEVRHNLEAEGRPLESLNTAMNVFQKESNEEDHVNQKQEKEKARKKFIFRAIAVSLSLATIIIIVVIIFITRDANTNLMISTEAPTFDVETCYLELSDETERFKLFRSILISEDINLLKSINSEGNKARAALCWIANFDRFQIEVKKGSNYEILQRYVMALVHFHFVGVLKTQENALQDLNWLREISVCDWPKVECGIASQKDIIVKLLLSDLQLDRQLPSELALLTKLTHLDMQDNALRGDIPRHIWSMNQLEVLKLGYNQLGGTISNSISNLHQLRQLDLAGNNFSGKIPNLNQLTNLTTLILQDIPQLGGPFPNISKSSYLETLILGPNAVTGSLSSGLWKLSNLKILKIDSTKVTGTFPSEIEKLRKLEELQLSSGFFEGVLPTEIGNLSRVRELDLQSLEEMTGTVPSELGRLTNLEKLDLLHTPFSGSFPDEICSIADIMITATCNILKNCTCCQCFYP